MNGVAAGHGTSPLDTMHAENPAGAEPAQTASALAAGTSQKRCVGSVRSAAFGWTVPVQAPPCGGSAVA
jgi:hypothetical protein